MTSAQTVNITYLGTTAILVGYLGSEEASLSLEVDLANTARGIEGKDHLSGFTTSCTVNNVTKDITIDTLKLILMISRFRHFAMDALVLAD